MAVDEIGARHKSRSAITWVRFPAAGENIPLKGSFAIMKKEKEEKKTDCKAGDLVEHTTQDFGRGRVMEVKDGIATIAFKKGGKKLFPSSSKYLTPAAPELPAE